MFFHVINLFKNKNVSILNSLKKFSNQSSEKYINLVSKKSFLLPRSQTFCFYSTNQQNIRKSFYKTKKKQISFGSFVLLIIPFSAFMLGVWQVRRRKWKLDLMEEMEKKVNKPPVDLPEDLNQLEKMEYMKVKVEGKFDHENEIYVLPRFNILNNQKNVPSQQGGAFVVTPFNLKDKNMKILVNRGWVPRSKTYPEARKEGQIEGFVKLVGVIRKNEPISAYTAPYDMEKRMWHVRDVDSMSSFLKTLPVFIDADKNSTIEGGPIGGQTKVNLRNDHLQYLLTWFTLSVATSIMWYRAFLK